MKAGKRPNKQTNKDRLEKLQGIAKEMREGKETKQSL
jgi:hypothetical protein